ncbi:MAG: rhodanese-related sulfurtransferase [Arenicella sp.]|jgi:rhodanese-related sulfurtransferase
MKILYFIPFCLLFSCSSEEVSDTPTSNSTNQDSIEASEFEETIESISELELQTVGDLDNETFNSYLAEKKGILIDVRTPEEYAEGNIKGSQNINFNEEDFSTQLDRLDPMVPVFVYCHGGTRSGKARDLLAKKGFIEIYNLENGFGNWSE